MDYIIFDLEWNQSNKKKEELKEVPFEIIEIGAIKLNSDFQFVSEFKSLIKPQIYKEMHYITKKLSHLKMEELKSGSPFVEVIEEFLLWCGTNYIFCTWGSLDLLELQRNMRYYYLEPLAKGPLQFYDIQKLFSIAFEDEKSRRTLEYAIDFLGIKKDVPFHRAYSDAYYAAKVLNSIDKAVMSNYSFDVFTVPRNKREEIYVVFDTYAKYISRKFDNKTAALTDREVISTRCYLCRKHNRRRIKWFSLNGKHYYNVSYCNTHGYMKAKVRIRKTEDKKVYIIKTTKFIDEEEMLTIKEKQEKVKINGKSRRY